MDGIAEALPVAVLPAAMRQDISTHQSEGVKDHPDAHKSNINVDCLSIGAGSGWVYISFAKQDTVARFLELDRI